MVKACSKDLKARVLQEVRRGWMAVDPAFYARLCLPQRLLLRVTVLRRPCAAGGLNLGHAARVMAACCHSKRGGPARPPCPAGEGAQQHEPPEPAALPHLVSWHGAAKLARTPHAACAAARDSDHTRRPALGPWPLPGAALSPVLRVSAARLGAGTRPQTTCGSFWSTAWGATCWRCCARMATCPSPLVRGGALWVLVGAVEAGAGQGCRGGCWSGL